MVYFQSVLITCGVIRPDFYQCACYACYFLCKLHLCFQGHLCQRAALGLPRSGCPVLPSVSSPTMQYRVWLRALLHSLAWFSLTRGSARDYSLSPTPNHLCLAPAGNPSTDFCLHGWQWRTHTAFMLFNRREGGREGEGIPSKGREGTTTWFVEVCGVIKEVCWKQPQMARIPWERLERRNMIH